MPPQPLGTERRGEAAFGPLSRQRSTYCRSFGHFFVSFKNREGCCCHVEQMENHRCDANLCVMADDEALGSPYLTIVNYFFSVSMSL